MEKPGTFGSSLNSDGPKFEAWMNLSVMSGVHTKKGLATNKRQGYGHKRKYEHGTRQSKSMGTQTRQKYVYIYDDRYLVVIH